MFSWLIRHRGKDPAGSTATGMAEQLYAVIVAQARQPFFYRDLGMADTIPGRFELLTLHMFIVLDRLAGKGGIDEDVAQALVDVMFQDMDDVARETGVGDMGVGPRLKKLARSFRSRLEYYKEAIEGDRRGSLPEALLVIHFGEDKKQQEKAVLLAQYVRDSQAVIAGVRVEDMVAGAPLFAELPGSAG